MRLPLWFAARTYWALGSIAALFAFSPGVAIFAPIATVAAVALAILLAIDYTRGPRASQIQIARRLPAHFALRAPATIGYDVTNRSRVEIRCDVAERPMRTLDVDAAEAALVVPAQSRVAFDRNATPIARGSDSLGTMYVWYENEIGLLRRRVRVPADQSFRVYPDLSAVQRYGALHVRNRLVEAGLRRMRLRGAGTEFESLREYGDGDAFRAIDWKASARRGKLMVMQREVERSQDVMLVLDCGRLMTARVGEQRKLDYAITAALSLASIASLAHDRVGAIAFAAEMLVARAPRSTAASIHGLTNALCDVEPRFEESDFARAAAYLRGHLSRRSLIVLFTDVIDPIAQTTVLAELASLAKRHVVLCVFINDAAIASVLDAMPDNVDDAYRLNVAITLANERTAATRTLARTGIDVIDVPAPKLTIATIEEYLRIKSRAIL